MDRHRGPILDQARRFFAMSEAEKADVHISRSPHFRGYSTIAEEKTQGISDIKETYDFGIEQAPRRDSPSDPLCLHGENLWPSTRALPTFRGVLSAFLVDVRRVGLHLLRGLLRGLELEVELRSILGPTDFSLARLLRYPNADALPELAGPGLGVHTDYGYLVFLIQNEVPGLGAQLRSGRWVSVVHRDRTVPVLIGDMLEVLTGGALVATPHRVSAIVGDRCRYSAVGFVEPGPEVEVRPLRGRRPAQHYGEHLFRALERSFPSAGSDLPASEEGTS